MDTLVVFLEKIRDGIFKLLPMKEEEMNGAVNYINDYIDALLVNMEGSLKTYSELRTQKNFLYAINELRYLSGEDISFKKWRKVVLNAVKEIDVLVGQYKEACDVGLL